MSFSQDVKRELCGVKPSGCCRKAECYGILLFNRMFSYNSMSLLTESEEVAIKCAELLKNNFGVVAKIISGGIKRDMYKVVVEEEADRLKILLGFGHNPKQTDAFFNDRIVSKECCISAFVRGAFLASGTISDPSKSYRAEIIVQTKQAADFLAEVLLKRGLACNVSKRSNNYVIYFKESENVEDFLTIMNATSHTLEIMNMRIYKDMRNRANRIRNCEDANISKTVNAAIRQKNAIAKLKSTGEFELLPDDLKEIANLRVDYPEASLNELCELFDAPINRSKLNYKLNKIIAYSEK